MTPARGKGGHEAKVPAPASGHGQRGNRRTELNVMLDRVRREYPRLVETFDNRMRRRGFGPARLLVAHVRVVEPLLESHETGFIERGWDELDRTQQAAFLKAGYKREEILLSRDDDLERARLLTSGRATWTSSGARP
jgi:hypothetical protein